VKLFKMLGLIAVAALMAMVFVGTGSAMAESTALCDEDPGTGAAEECPAGHLVTHVHATTLVGNKARLLTGFVDIECAVLFLGEAIGESSEPLLMKGNFTYTSCTSGCTFTEENGPAIIEVLKLGHETADVTGEFEVHLSCGGLNCYYNGEGLEATVLGPLLSSETNGEVSIQQQELHLVKGLFCPSGTTLDIRITPLSATYIEAVN